MIPAGKAVTTAGRGAAAMAGIAAGLALVVLCAVRPSYADFEVTAPDGRRILLKDDKTWSYVEAKAGDKPLDMAQLRIERKIELTNACRFGLRMVNTLPYEIRSLVPQFSAYNSKKVLYDTVFMAFSRLRPTDSQYREIQFGLPCAEISRIQVTGGDRCEMGDFDRFNSLPGECLKRIQLAETELVPFTK